VSGQYAYAIGGLTVVWHCCYQCTSLYHCQDVSICRQKQVVPSPSTERSPLPFAIHNSLKFSS